MVSAKYRSSTVKPSYHNKCYNIWLVTKYVVYLRRNKEMINYLRRLVTI